MIGYGGVSTGCSLPKAWRLSLSPSLEDQRILQQQKREVSWCSASRSSDGMYKNKASNILCIVNRAWDEVTEADIYRSGRQF